MKATACGTFDLKKNSVIWIYGAGKKGRTIAERLVGAGYYVEGFLDKRCDSLGEVCGRRVFFPEEAARVVSQEDIVIITLENGLQQEIVAEELAAVGCYRLIYLPMHIKQSLSVRRQYRENYMRLLNSDFEHIGGVPIFGQETAYTDYVIIKRRYSKVIFWCKTDHVHVGVFESKNISAELWDVNQDILKQYSDKKIEELQPYMELFQYLEGKKADLYCYMEMQGRKTKEQREALLNDRKDLYQVYEQAYKYEMDFFADSPLEAIWNEKGYFNVQDGLHRGIYLISKGATEVPVAVPIDDFEKYKKFYERMELVY